MMITVIRLIILYCFITIAVRLMGKRQVGELHPTELVVTILLSELIAIPIQDNSLPMVTSLIAGAILISLEIISSVIAMHSKGFSKLTQGTSVPVIAAGKLDTEQLRNLRLTLEDLQEALRLKDVFDLTEVETCVMETNGQISVQLKPQFRPLTPETNS